MVFSIMSMDHVTLKLTGFRAERVQNAAARLTISPSHATCASTAALASYSQENHVYDSSIIHKAVLELGPNTLLIMLTIFHPVKRVRSSTEEN